MRRYLLRVIGSYVTGAAVLGVAALWFGWEVATAVMPWIRVHPGVAL
jgi:fructose-specific phosphotransferase system IIC component